MIAVNPDEIDPAQARMDDLLSDRLDEIAERVARSMPPVMSDEEFDEMTAAIAAPIRFWRCPVAEHRGGPLRVEVEWRGNVAHCTWPGCGRTSTDKREDATT